MTTAAAPAIPRLDLSAALAGDPDARAELARRIDEVCRDIGFFTITGHGIDQAVIDDVRSLTAEFFAQPDEYKARYASVTGNEFRGWSVRDAMAVTPEGPAPVRVREQMEMCRFDSPADVAAAGYDAEWVERAEPNLWPDRPVGLEAAWKRYHAAVDDLGLALLSLMDLALGLPEGYLEVRFRRHPSYLACNWYLTPDVEFEGHRFGEHTDVGSLTIVYQDDGPAGIEVLDRAGRWVPIDHEPGAFVVNLGDLMAKWTNDRWVATEHRVRNPEPGERRTRISIPYFQHPDYDALIECLPGCSDAAHPPRYPAVLAGNWATYRFDTYEKV
jgi:isopenicillin N synthase-like dioxygenase